jgi:hypothetical protein
MHCIFRVSNLDKNSIIDYSDVRFFELGGYDISLRGELIFESYDDVCC